MMQKYGFHQKRNNKSPTLEESGFCYFSYVTQILDTGAGS